MIGLVTDFSRWKVKYFSLTHNPLRTYSTSVRCKMRVHQTALHNLAQIVYRNVSIDSIYNATRAVRQVVLLLDTHRHIVVTKKFVGLFTVDPKKLLLVRHSKLAAGGFMDTSAKLLLYNIVSSVSVQQFHLPICKIVTQCGILPDVIHAIDSNKHRIFVPKHFTINSKTFIHPDGVHRNISVAQSKGTNNIGTQMSRHTVLRLEESSRVALGWRVKL